MSPPKALFEPRSQTDRMERRFQIQRWNESPARRAKRIAFCRAAGVPRGQLLECLPRCDPYNCGPINGSVRMPVWSRQWPFLDYTIEAAPLNQGVYGLWQAGELIFVGATDDRTSLRQCLQEHSKTEPRLALDHYSWEVSDDPQTRKLEVLEQFHSRYGRLPRLNMAPIHSTSPAPHLCAHRGRF
jgi:hypothetical protein